MKAQIYIERQDNPLTDTEVSFNTKWLLKRKKRWKYISYRKEQLKKWDKKTNKTNQEDE